MLKMKESDIRVIVEEVCNLHYTCRDPVRCPFLDLRREHRVVNLCYKTCHDLSEIFSEKDIENALLMCGINMCEHTIDLISKRISKYMDIH